MSNEFIYGIHAVKAVLEREPERFIEAYVLKGRQDDRLMPILNDLQVCGVSIQQMTRKTLDDKARGANHQGIIARVKPAKQLNENDIDDILAKHESPLLLVL
ncbi:RNA methyltransferase substrate-binding domain-containing protein, partial [Vibrio parahaemolyticus]|nr:RNA methyltransferase substrate-binding domain-containing protein [Vibrio parahaemolyticus]